MLNIDIRIFGQCGVNIVLKLETNIDPSLVSSPKEYFTELNLLALSMMPYDALT